MILFFVRNAFRNLKRNPLFTVINLVGMSLGLAIVVIITAYISNELTYDTCYQDSERIFRLYEETDAGNYQMFGAQVFAPLGPFLLAHFPQVEKQTRVSDPKKFTFEVGSGYFDEEIVFADPEFFSIFTLRSTIGVLEGALSEPFSMVITQKIADRFFGVTDPVGQVVKVDQAYSFRITAVVENVPENSHLKFDILCSISSIKRMEKGQGIAEGWGMRDNKYYTYVKLQDKDLKCDLEAEFPSIIDSYVSPEEGTKCTLSLQPLEQIYLYYDGGGSLSRIILFATIALFVLLIACFNYMNLNIAISLKSLKGIGVRKVIGVNRFQLFLQILFDSLIFCVIALAIALMLSEITLPVFNTILQKKLHLNFLSDWKLSLSCLGIVFITSLMAGVYPGLYLSGLKPVDALKGKFIIGSLPSRLRNFMVILQFSISIFLIGTTGVIYFQMKYIGDSSLGFDKDNVVLLKLEPKNYSSQFDNHSESHSLKLIKNELSSIPEIENVSIASGFPFCGIMINQYMIYDTDGEHILISYHADSNYVDLLDFNIIKGEGFSGNDKMERNNVLINQTMAGLFNGINPIGRRFRPIDGNGKIFTVIGILKDFHFMSYHQKILPAFINYSDKESYQKMLGFRINHGDPQEVISKAENVFSDLHLPERADFTFLSGKIEENYTEENRVGEMFTNFAVMAIIIATIGLYGLTVFINRSKNKEVAIRKLYGGTTSDIIKSVSTSYFSRMLIAVIIGMSASWFYSKEWLSSFTYQVQGVWIIILASAITGFCIAGITILLQSIKVAKINLIHCITEE